MKKFILSALCLLGLLSSQSHAQVGRWYSYAEYVVNNSAITTGDYNVYRDIIWNDTNAITHYTGSGYVKNKQVSMGISFAPRLAAWDDVSLYGSSIKVGSGDAFTIDSVTIQGSYRRNNAITAPRDTVRLAFVNGNGTASTNITTAGSSGGHYGGITFIDMLYDSVRNIAGKSPSVVATPYVQSVILSNTDTATIFVKTYALTTPYTVPAGQCAAMSLSFKSGDPSFFAGDTVIYASGQVKHGSFMPYSISYASPSGDVEWAPFSSIDSNIGYLKILPQTGGWSGLYIPHWNLTSGTPSGASAFQYPIVDFHIKCPTCRLNEDIAGTAAFCAGTTTLLTHGLPGGTWSTSAIGIATVSATGTVSGIAGGTAIITYNVSGNFTTRVVTVTPLPAVGTIVGPSTVCAGDMIAMSNATPGGTWSSSAAGIAGIDFWGDVTGIAVGTATISYAVTNICGTTTVTKTVTVNGLPSAGTISGPATVCIGSTITLASTVPGGTWTSLIGNVSVSSGGIVTGLALGTDNVVYLITNVCGTGSTNVTVAIEPSPVVGVTSGPDNVCIGSSITLANTVSGGSWSASNGNASVSGTGDVSGVTAGTVSITYEIANACGSANTQKLITVNDCTTGVNDITGTLSDVSIFPNPASSNITIAASSLVKTVVISNMIGQKVFSGIYHSNSVTINLGQLSQGVYTIRINDSKVYKVTKQ